MDGSSMPQQTANNDEEGHDELMRVRPEGQEKYRRNTSESDTQPYPSTYECTRFSSRSSDYQEGIGSKGKEY